MRDLADNVEELRQVPVAELIAAPDLGGKLRGLRAALREEAPRPRRAHAKRHVRILRIGDDERARGAVGLYLGELGFEGFHFLATD